MKYDVPILVWLTLDEAAYEGLSTDVSVTLDFEVAGKKRRKVIETEVDFDKIQVIYDSDQWYEE